MGEHLITFKYLLPRLSVICVDDALVYAIENDKTKVKGVRLQLHFRNVVPKIRKLPDFICQ